MIQLCKPVFQEIPLKVPSVVGAGKTFASIWFPSKMQVIITKIQAMHVVMRAPTAIGQKSLGVPIHVIGVRPTATITIHTHRERLNPVDPIKDPRSWAIRTMKTQPPPYRVREMATIETILKLT